MLNKEKIERLMKWTRESLTIEKVARVNAWNKSFGCGLEKHRTIDWKLLTNLYRLHLSTWKHPIDDLILARTHCGAAIVATAQLYSVQSQSSSINRQFPINKCLMQIICWLTIAAGLETSKSRMRKRLKKIYSSKVIICWNKCSTDSEIWQSPETDSV